MPRQRHLSCFCGTTRHFAKSKLGFNGAWILCDGCRRWCHGDCVSMTKEQTEQFTGSFSCPECTDTKECHCPMLIVFTPMTIDVLHLFVSSHFSTDSERITIVHQSEKHSILKILAHQRYRANIVLMLDEAVTPEVLQISQLLGRTLSRTVKPL